MMRREVTYFNVDTFRRVLLEEDVFPPEQVEGLTRALALAFGFEWPVGSHKADEGDRLPH